LEIRNELAHLDLQPPTDEELARILQVMFTADTQWDLGKIDDSHDDWGDLPDPLEDNFICVDQGLTDTDDWISFDRDQEIDRLCRSIKFMIEDHKHELMVDNLNVRQQKEKVVKLRPNFG
jgi:hypothetical protein